jgi:hypothetical protein
LTRRMADTCYPANYPPGMDLYASYVDGSCASARSDPVRISSIATDAGNVGDCEPGNPSWGTWIGWVRRRRAAGVDPTIYCIDDGQDEGSNFWKGWHHRDGVAAFGVASVAEPHWWVAHPDGDSTMPSYAVAVQYGYPGPYDLSIVRDYWPGVDLDPRPDPPGRPLLLEESGMHLIISPNDTLGGLPFVIPDLYEAGGDPASEIRSSWVGVCAQDVDTVVDVMAWRQDGSWIGDTGDKTLKAPVQGISGPWTLAVNAFTQWGYKGAYTLGIVIRSGGRLHVGYHMQ